MVFSFLLAMVSISGNGDNAIALILPFIILALIWWGYSRSAELPDNHFAAFMPFFITFCYYIGAWILVYGLSGYRVLSDTFGQIFPVITLPFFFSNSIAASFGGYYLFPIAIAGGILVSIFFFILPHIRRLKGTRFDKRILIYILGFVVLSGAAGYQRYDAQTKVLTDKYEMVAHVQGDFDLNSHSSDSYIWDYAPFVDGNKLEKLDERPTVTITDNYPKLDGATAAYPVYAATAQALYAEMDPAQAEQYVACSTTGAAYDRLIDGDIDIFFGAQPSVQEIQKAKERGVEFTLTPVAKEAFVFIVNKNNPVSNLTIEQIQTIYQRKITNWKEVGGNDERIVPFQRQENSGSQTVMLAAVMKGKPLAAPVWEEPVSTMNGEVDRVADYINYPSAIGYSFRYFTVGMNANKNVKLLAVNGIEPSVDNIKNGTYPFAIDAYAVTAGTKNKNAEKLIQWMTSAQGQDFIEKCGYVRE